MKWISPIALYSEKTLSVKSPPFFFSLTHFPLQRHVIPSPTRTLVLRLAEVGHLYMRVDAFIQEREGQSGVGMIEQSLCHHLQTQLTEYYRLIAVLESQMSIGVTGDGVTHEGDIRQEESGLTLKRLDVWIQDWRLRMRMMSACVEGCKGMQTMFSLLYPILKCVFRFPWRSLG